ncbi:MAG: carboxypeptidase-like regulatory domain-containing protein [Paludibacteraceae bacterium]|nr:carboxypeptidase-like regulatory domain-containing protein [Paludibacteraceae bacterium]
MRRLITTLLAGIFCFALFAQTSLKGVVVTDENNSPVPGAKITLANQNISTTTNSSGEFALIYLEAMDEEVLIEAAGYFTAVRLIQLKADQSNDMGTIALQTDIQREMEDEVVLQLSDLELNDDEGRSQSTSSGSNASTDVFNSATGYAWSTVRYRQRGYEQQYEQTYINGINFNTQERGNFNFSMIGGLNDASRNKDEVNGLEANGYTYGSLGKSTNIMMDATRYAQGFKAGLSGTNRNYKGRAFLTYASGLLPSGWAFVGSVAWRYSPYIDHKGIIGEGIKYNSLGYFFSAQKNIGDNHSLSFVTFGSPTERAQNAAVTQEVYNLTGSINYNPYWGYQNGKVRNSRIVKAFDPTAILSYDWKISENQTFKAGLGYHYSLYSNSALTFYNAPDPRPDYYRNLPSFLWDGQIGINGEFITKDGSGRDLGNKYFLDNYNSYTGEDGKYYDARWIGPSVDQTTYKNMTDAWTSRDNNTTQINWDNIYAANYAYDKNEENNPLRSSKYMLERRHNDIQEGMLNINYQNSEYDHLKITAGLEAKLSQGLHYKTVDDLLGGTQWLDVDPFAERDIKDLAVNIGMTQAEIEKVKQNDINLTDEERIVKKGDRFGYDYRINMTSAKAWVQNEWNYNDIDFYYALQLTYTGMQRTSSMINGRAWYLATLHSDNAYAQWQYLGPQYNAIMNNGYRTMQGTRFDFVDPSFKAGLTYKINGRNRLKLNVIAETSAPLARDAYISPRVHDRVIDPMYKHLQAKSLQDFYAASQKVAGGDITYEFNFPVVRGRITGYFTQFWNGSELNGYYDDEARTFVNQSLTGINRRHMGIEAAAAFKLGTYFTLTPMLAIADYRYTSNAYSITSAENGMSLAENINGPLYELGDSVLIKGLKVAAGPQLNASLKLSFFHPKMWFADITVSYFDWNWLDYAPSRRMKGLYTGVRADGSTVNGNYTNVHIDHDNTISAIKTDADGNTVTDAYGTPQLIYPFNILSDQESLVDSKVWNRFMIDVSVGKLIYLPKRQSLSINLSVSNVTNNTHMKTGGYQQARLPRQSVQGETDNTKNSTLTPNVWKFPSKYYYAYGVNFFLNVTYKF